MNCLDPYYYFSFHSLFWVFHMMFGGLTQQEEISFSLLWSACYHTFPFLITLDAFGNRYKASGKQSIRTWSSCARRLKNSKTCFCHSRSAMLGGYGKSWTSCLAPIVLSRPHSWTCTCIFIFYGWIHFYELFGNFWLATHPSALTLIFLTKYVSKSYVFYILG